MAAKCKLSVPLYKPDSGYNYYKDLILAWAEVTETPEESQGIRVALSFNDVDQKLCEKIFTVVTRDVLKKKDGFTRLIAFLDKELGKDALEEIVSIYDDFEDCRRQPGITMNDYLSNFDQKSNLLKGKGITLPPEILGFKLLRGAVLTKEERALVLSGIDYDKRDSLYEQAKKSLKKFKGEGGSVSCSGSDSNFGGAGCSGFSASSSGAAIKAEPTFFTGTRGNFNRPYRAPTYQGRPYQRGSYGWRGVRPSGNEAWRGVRQGAPVNDSWRGYRGSSMASRGTPHTQFSNWRGFPVGTPGNSSGRSWRSSHKGEKKVNPIGLDGQPLQCACCKSVFHFLKDCPDTWENLKSVNLVDETGDMDEYGANQAYSGEAYDYDQYNMCMGTVQETDSYTNQYDNYNAIESNDQHVVLYTGSDKTDVLQLEVEAHNKAVLDCACSSTVCGKAWLEDFLNSRTPDDKRLVERRDSSKTFRFGNDGCLNSQGEYALPANLVGNSVTIITDVVDSNIPLLLSLTALKAAGVIIDTVSDSAVILGKRVPLDRTSSGHYCVPIAEYGDSVDNSVLAVDIEKYTQNDRYKALLKLHRSMGHPTEAKLVSFLKDANSWHDVYGSDLTQICEQCDVCKQFAKTPPRPVVSLPMASKFNEKVAMDLKAWQQRWILHIIDMWSRYTISVFVSRKTPSTIIDGVIIHWLAYFGTMGTILTDNGGEFRNDELRSVCSVLNVEVLGTAAESPFQNGLCEKNHQVTDMILLKLTHDFPHIRPEILLRWANMSKNTLQMWNGYSSNQLVFGVNPNLPNVFEASLPALEEATMSRTLSEHLEILHASRKAFIESESSERIRRALRNRIRASETVYKRGDRVFYKRDKSLMWLGPARVVFQDRKVVLLDHGGFYIKVSPNRLVKASDQFVQVKAVDGLPSQSLHEKLDDDSMPEDDEQRVVENQHQERNHTVDLQEDASQERNHISDIQDNQVILAGLNMGADNNDQQNGEISTENADNTDDQSVVEADPQIPVIRRSSLRVLNKEKGWNVYIVTIPRNRHCDKDCIDAKEIELDKLHSFGVYEQVQDCGQQCISTRWVLWKKGDDVRARLVARGFEEDSSNTNVDSPTVGKSTVRLVLTIAASRHWVIKTTDIKSAFLQGSALQRDVYITPPSEANVPEGFVWKLNRCLYGLNDAARQFYDSVVEELINLGCVKSNLDPSLFFKSNPKGLSGVIVSHIDDFLHAGDQNFDSSTTGKLCQRFLAGRNQMGQFRYVGYQITQRDGSITLDQNSYLDSIEFVTLSAQRAMKKCEPLTKQEMTQFRSLVGSLNWVVQGTRPDLAFSLLELSTKFKNATIEDLIKAQKVLQKAKASKSEIVFPDLGNVSDWRIVVYTDASFGNLCDGVSSCGGYIVFIAGVANKVCPIAWKSGKIKRVVSSTLAAEALALADGIEEAIYVKEILIKVLSLSKTYLPIITYVDHRGLHDSVRSTKCVDSRSLRINIAEIKEHLYKGIVRECRHCISGEQLADCLTKKGVDGRKLLAVLQSGILKH